MNIINQIKKEEKDIICHHCEVIIPIGKDANWSECWYQKLDCLAEFPLCDKCYKDCNDYCIKCIQYHIDVDINEGKTENIKICENKSCKYNNYALPKINHIHKKRKLNDDNDNNNNNNNNNNK